MLGAIAGWNWWLADGWWWQADGTNVLVEGDPSDGIGKNPDQRNVVRVRFDALEVRMGQDAFDAEGVFVGIAFAKQVAANENAKIGLLGDLRRDTPKFFIQIYSLYNFQ